MNKTTAAGWMVSALFFSAGLLPAGENWQKPFEPDEHTLGLWKFDMREGTTVIDASRHQNHGKLFGIERQPLAAYTEGKFQNGVETCETGWVDIPDKDYYLGMDKLTVEAWVYIYNPRESIGVLKSRSGEIVSASGYTLRLDEKAERVEFVVHTEKGVVSAASTPLKFEEWHHVAGTYDGKECKIFIDGQPAVSAQSSGPGSGRIIKGRSARPADRQLDSPTVPRIYSPVSIGGGINSLNAVIDEARISDVVRY